MATVAYHKSIECLTPDKKYTSWNPQCGALTEMERPLGSSLFTVGTFTYGQNVSEGLSPWTKELITIKAPLIYTAPCILFWMGAYTLRGEVDVPV
jgi:hypothetical protein